MTPEPSKKVKIAVVQFNEELLVKIEVFEGDDKVGEGALPGGDLENARAMAEGLVAWVEAGGDIMEILPGSD